MYKAVFHPKGNGVGAAPTFTLMWLLDALIFACTPLPHCLEEMLTFICTYVYIFLPSVLPKVTGWEKNSKNKVLAKMVNLSSSMDPVRCGVVIQAQRSL